MESAMETNKDAKVVSKKKQNIVYSEVKAISHIGKKKYGTDDFETWSYFTVRCAWCCWGDHCPLKHWFFEKSPKNSCAWCCWGDFC